MLSLTIIIILCSTIVYVTHRVKNKKIYDFMFTVPSSREHLPIIGCLIPALLAWNPEKLYQNVLRFTQSLTKEKLVGIWIGPRPILVVNNPEYIKDILMNSNSISKSNLVVNAMKPWFGESIPVLGPPMWNHHRKLIQQTFSHKNLESFIPIYVRQSDILIKCIRNQVGNDLFDIGPYIDKFAVDTICATTMGIEISTQINSHVPVFEWLKYGLHEMANRSIKMWLNPNFLFKLSPGYNTHLRYSRLMRNFIEEVVKRKKEKMSSKNSTKTEEFSRYADEKSEKNFLDFLLELNKCNVFTDKDIHDETFAVFLAGYETTAITIAVALMLLGNHSDIQAKVYDEIIHIIGHERVDLNNDDLTRMKYLEMVVKETIRLHTPVPIIPRVTTGDIPLSNGLIIPNGVECLIVPNAVHKDPELWPNPDEFNPDRFLLEAVNERHPYSFLAFGGGMRSCIGYKYAIMEVVVVLALLIRKYEFFTPCKYKDLQFGYMVTKKVSNGYNVQIKLRD